MVALKRYPRGVPISINYPVMPVTEFWRNSTRKFPERDAVVYLNEGYTYAELWGQMESFASNLMGLGVRTGDRVALILPNCPQFIIAYNAIHLCGGTVVAINPLMSKKEIEREIAVTDSRVVIILDRLMDKLPEEHPELIVAEAAYYAPVHLRFLSKIKYRNKLPEHSQRFEDLIHGRKVDNFPEVDPKEDVAVIMFTSGTTGEPKGVELTHYGQVVNALQSYHWLRGWGYSAKPQEAGWPIILCAMPFFHSYGLVVMNEAVSFGCTMILLPKPSAETIIKATHEHKVTHFPLIPRLIREVLNYPELEKYDLTSLTTCSSGGASIPIPLMKEFEKVSGARMYQGYGLTEAGPIITATPVEGKPKYASVGLPYPDTEVKIVDLQLGEIEMPAGKDGEIIVKGPQLMKSYLNGVKETTSVVRNKWLYTGDTGRLDEEGYLYIVGRKEYRIISDGRTVWPTKVEDTLVTHPKVKHAIAFGVPDPLRCSTNIRAMVVPQKGVGAEGLEQELIDLCTEKLEEYMIPTRIMFRDTLPLTVMGKVDRKKILDEIESIIKKATQGLDVSELD